MGKSTLLQGLLDCLGDRPYYGFRTEKLSPEGKPGCVAEIFAQGGHVPYPEVTATVSDSSRILRGEASF